MKLIIQIYIVATVIDSLFMSVDTKKFVFDKTLTTKDNFKKRVIYFIFLMLTPFKMIGGIILFFISGIKSYYRDLPKNQKEIENETNEDYKKALKELQ